MINSGTLKIIDIEDGKYTLVFHVEHGGLTVLRNGEVWRNETGDKLMLAMLHEIDRLRSANKELTSLNLWSARRLRGQHHKNFAYDCLEKITSEKHERL